MKIEVGNIVPLSPAARLALLTEPYIDENGKVYLPLIDTLTKEQILELLDME